MSQKPGLLVHIFFHGDQRIENDPGPVVAIRRDGARHGIFGDYTMLATKLTTYSSAPFANCEERRGEAAKVG